MADPQVEVIKFEVFVEGVGEKEDALAFIPFVVSQTSQ